MLKPDLSSIIRPINFPKRHGFTMADLRETIDKFKGLRVTVLGDIMLMNTLIVILLACHRKTQRL